MADYAARSVRQFGFPTRWNGRGTRRLRGRPPKLEEPLKAAGAPDVAERAERARREARLQDCLPGPALRAGAGTARSKAAAADGLEEA